MPRRTTQSSVPDTTPSLMAQVAVASGLMTFVALILLLFATVFVLWFQPDLSQDSLLPLAIGGGLIGGFLISGIGFVAGIAESQQATGHPVAGPVFLSMLVNGTFLVFVLGMVAMAFLKT